MSLLPFMVPPTMEFRRSFTIKVKNGDSLKRLTAYVTGNNLDLSIAKLREKIILAFNLSPSADFIMTYSDIDGDTVKLDDDEDLRDAAISQKLNPLRINVQLTSQLRNDAPPAEPKPNAANSTRRRLLENLSLIGSSLDDLFISSSPRDFLLTKRSTQDTAQASRPSNVPSSSSSSPASVTKATAPTASSEPTTTTTPAAKKCKEPKMVPGFDKEWFPFPKDGIKPTNSCDKEWFPITKDAKEKATSERQYKGKAVMQNASHKGPFYAPQPGPHPHMRHDPQQIALLKGSMLGPQPGSPPSMHSPYHRVFPLIDDLFSFNEPLPSPPPVFDFPVDKAFLSHVNGNADAPSSDVPPYPTRQHYKEDGYKSMFEACLWEITCDGCNEKIFVSPCYKSIVNDDHYLCANCFTFTHFGKPDEYGRIGYPTPSRMAKDFNAETTDVQGTSEPIVTITASNDKSTLHETRVAVIEPETNTVNISSTSIPPTVSDPLITDVISPTLETVLDPRHSVPMLEVVQDNEDILLCMEDPCDFSECEWDSLLEEIEEVRRIID